MSKLATITTRHTNSSEELESSSGKPLKKQWVPGLSKFFHRKASSTYVGWQPSTGWRDMHLPAWDPATVAVGCLASLAVIYFVISLLLTLGLVLFFH
jgi:hypothetical protein